MLALTNQVPPFQDLQVILDGRYTEAGLAGNGLQTGPAIALASGTAEKVGVQQKCSSPQVQVEHLVAHPEVILRGRGINCIRNYLSG